MANLPVNPLTRQLVNPLTRQPVNPLTRQPVNPSTRQPVNPLTRQPVNLLTRQPVNPLTRYMLCKAAILLSSSISSLHSTSRGFEPRVGPTIPARSN